MSQELKSKTFLILNTKYLILIAIIAVVIAFIVYMQQSQTYKKVLIVNDAKITVEIADNVVEQTRGLSGRESLCENCGMLFVYEEPKIQNFWMKGMRFPLDIIYISNGKIIEIYENLPAPQQGESPAQISSKNPADMVLELNAGYVENNEIKIGNSINFDN